MSEIFAADEEERNPPQKKKTLKLRPQLSLLSQFSNKTEGSLAKQKTSVSRSVTRK